MMMMKAVLLQALVVATTTSMMMTSAFVCPSTRPASSFVATTTTTRLHAQEKEAAAAPAPAPQFTYEKMDMVLVESKTVGEGASLLTLTPKDSDAGLDYQAGHVVALEMQAPDEIANEKIAKDAANNDGWMRGPYTITRCFENKSVDILSKVVGDKSQYMEKAEPGTPFKLGGKFKVPIVEGIVNVADAVDDDSSSNNDEKAPQAPRRATRRAVLLSTGVGIGPCIGAVEEWLKDEKAASSSVERLDLVASFRTDPEVVCRDDLDALSKQSAGLFHWQPVVTSATGRVSDSEENLQTYVTTNKSDTICSLLETHYHLIGNGQLVQEWQQGLAQAGVPTERVTTEIYFNTRCDLDDDRIAHIAKAIEAAAVAVPEGEAVASSS